MPVIVLFRSTPAGPFTALTEAFRAGIADEGLVENETVRIDYRWGNNNPDLLPGIARELVDSAVSVIVGNSVAVEAARAATSTIPIVFVAADDPVKSGLVDNLARPSGNLTGLTFFGGGELAAKRTELLLEIVPQAHLVGLLLDPNYPAVESARRELEAAVNKLGRRFVVAESATSDAFEAAFAKISEAGAEALVVAGSPFQTSQRKKIVELSAARRLPAIYDQSSYVADGGLVSYATSFTAAYRQAGAYAARLAKGAKPADLPVLRPTIFELAVNLGTAKALGITIPNSILLQADEVIEP
ncbi:ABC transporter substrate-binding protein [Prosthecomicrobium sp. N25]|uniref:ABC transporter substrate-binding protein n=1 Tax=Prosthecomicrobium sp. N25 TaxID=3129254 RepID=UPI003076AB12